MTQEEFKAKYFTNNFYWINESNYKQLQEIALEIGCLCHTMKSEMIEWHTGFRNLGFNPHRENPDLIVFQKRDMLMYNQTATKFDEMVRDYNCLGFGE